MTVLKRIITTLICLIAITGFSQKTIEGVTLPKQITIEGETLELNGGGLREKLWFNLYVGGLYLGEKSSDAKSIINADKTMAIHLEVTSKLINSDNMSEAIKDGFEKSTNGDPDQFAEQIPALINAFKDDIVLKDQFDIAYNPKVGVIVSKNGKQLTTIRGFEFKKALFAIWLGEKPADKNLKKDMLGL